MSREAFSARAMRVFAAHRAAVFLALGVLLFVPFGYALQSDALEFVELGTGWLNQLFGHRQLIESHAKLTRDLDVEIVGFDKTATLENYADLLPGNPPLRALVEAKGVAYDRSVYAAVLDRLADAGARAVVFDFVFEGKGPSDAGDAAFAAAIRRHRDKVVLGFDYTFTERSKGLGSADSQKTAERREPFEDLLPDERTDEVLGFVTVWPRGDGSVSSMTAREDRITLAKPEMAASLKRFEDMSLTARAASKLGALIPEDNAARLIRFVGPARSFRMTPVQDLFTPDRWKLDLGDGARFKGKAVVVGPHSEIYYKDAFGTPFGVMLGVEIQANAIQNYLDAGWLRRPLDGPRTAALAAGMFLLVWVATALVRTRRTLMRLLVVFGLLGLYAIGAYIAFARADLFLPISPALFAGVLALTYVLLDFVHAQYEKSRIKGMFGTYLSPEIVNRMIASGEEPKLGGEQVRLTAFFSDIQSFSSFSEVLTPEQLVEIMNAYLGAMTDILEADAGTLDKYIGDAIVAMFGAPIALADHAHRACACALRMQARLAELRAEWAALGDKWPKKIHAMRMRIGLNTGAATVGNMGSAKRFNYTMMGDTVNLAARCESGAKSAGVYTLVSGETMDAARASTGRPILFRRIDKWKVKGRSAPVLMVEVVDFLDAAAPSTRECVRLYEAGLDRYLVRDFTGAKALFEQARPLEPLQPGRDPGVEHSASEIMSDRCTDMLANIPPSDWDGVYEMKSK